MSHALVLTDDAYKDDAKQRAAFAKVRIAERYYAAQLRAVANHIDALIKGMAPTDAQTIDMLQRILERYADILRPWARSVSSRLLAEVARRDANAWVAYGRTMGVALRKQINDAPLGDAVRRIMDEQVDLITSLPLDAAKRVHQIAIGQLYSGERKEALAHHIMQTGLVTRSRAMLIARTETGRAATALAEARGVWLGSPGYIWRTAGDYKVRPELDTPHFAELNTLAKGSHRKLSGTFHKWREPPIAGPRGERAHAGAIYNCRCWPEPVLPANL